MEKVAKGFYRIKEQHIPVIGVCINMEIDLIDGEYLDTQVGIMGEFVIEGSQRKEFLKELESLIRKYRI